MIRTLVGVAPQRALPIDPLYHRTEAVFRVLPVVVSANEQQDPKDEQQQRRTVPLPLPKVRKRNPRIVST